MFKATVVPVRGRYRAAVSLDLRYQDAVAIEAYGPLLYQFGNPDGSGTESSQTSADDLGNDIQDVLDGLVVTKFFTSVGRALAWQNRVEYDIRIALNRLRQQYAVYPGEYPNRYRTV